jgi:hypothetical protein
VRIHGETVCAIPEIAGELADPTTIARVYDPNNNGKPIAFANDRTGILHVGLAPFVHRLWTILRCKSWRSPELKIARLLFHLERHGIAAPKLLAYGQVTPRFQSAKSFVIQEPVAGKPIRQFHLESTLELLSRLHDASCSVRSIGNQGEPFSVVGGHVVIGDISRLRLARALSERRMLREFVQVVAFFEGRR